MRPAIKRNIMSKYIDAEKLIAELKRQKRELELSIQSQGDYGQSCQIVAYENIISLISSLQQEDASKMERLNVDILLDWSMRFAPDIRDAIEATAYHFWNLAINSRKEE